MSHDTVKHCRKCGYYFSDCECPSSSVPREESKNTRIISPDRGRRTEIMKDALVALMHTSIKHRQHLGVHAETTDAEIREIFQNLPEVDTNYLKAKQTIEQAADYFSTRMLNPKETKLLHTLLNETIHSLNHGCCDVPEELFEDWTLEERQQLVKQYHEFNGDPKEYDPKYIHLGDCSIMSFLLDKLFKAEETESAK